MKALLTSAIILLIITNAHAGTFYEDFEDESLALWSRRGEEGEWVVEHGELSGSWRSIKGHTYLVRGWMGTWKNYVVKVKVKVIKWERGKNLIAELLIGVRQLWNKEQNHMDGVFFVLTQHNTTSLFARFGNSRSARTGRDVEMELNKWYDVKLIVKENAVSAYFDERFIGTWTSKIGNIELFTPVSPRGGVSFGLFRAHAHFDNVIISGANVPHSGRNISQKGKLATSWGNIKVGGTK